MSTPREKHSRKYFGPSGDKTDQLLKKQFTDFSNNIDNQANFAELKCEDSVCLPCEFTPTPTPSQGVTPTPTPAPTSSSTPIPTSTPEPTASPYVSAQYIKSIP